MLVHIFHVLVHIFHVLQHILVGLVEITRLADLTKIVLKNPLIHPLIRTFNYDDGHAHFSPTYFFVLIILLLSITFLIVAIIGVTIPNDVRC